MSIVMRLLKEAIEKCDIEHAAISADIAKLAIKLKEVNNTKDEYVSTLQDNCTHSKSKRVEGSYSAGGYDHVSEEHYTIECVDCGLVLESKCVRGTYA